MASSTPDTDFAGKLLNVYSYGRAVILAEGILLAGNRAASTEPKLLEPGTIYGLRLDL